MKVDLYIEKDWIPDFIHDSFIRLWEGTAFPEGPVIPARIYYSKHDDTVEEVDIEDREIESVVREYARGIKRDHCAGRDRLALRRLVWLAVHKWLESYEYQEEVDRAGDAQWASHQMDRAENRGAA